MLERRIGIAAVTAWGILLLAQAGCEQKKPVITLKQNDEPLISTSQVNATPIATRSEPISVDQPVSAKSFQEGERAFGEKRYDEATSIFTAYTVEKPQNPWGHYMLGLAAWKSNDLDKAEGEFLKTLELDPTHLKSMYNLGRVYLDRGEKEKAGEQIESALKLDSTSSEGFRLLGRVKEEMGLLADAETAYRQALKLDPEDTWSMNNLGINLIKQDRAEEAVGVLARVVEVKPDNTLFQNNLGMALELNGYFVKAGEAYQKAVELDSTSEKAIDNLARVNGHPDKTGIPELKLEELAQNFVMELNSAKVSSN
jgi:Flp pilus assembly protein TadD